MLQHAAQAFLIAAILAPAAWWLGQVARRLRLPQITGYVVSGILVGPYGLGILSSESVGDLNVVEGTCLGIIGLAAGAELHLSELNKAKKQVAWITGCICVSSWAMCYAAFAYMGRAAPFAPGMSQPAVTAFSSLGATIMMARSPASAIAVLKEVGGRGPFCSLVMGVVVLKDVAVILAFAVNMELVPLIIHASSTGLSVRHALLPVLSVAVSILAGMLGGMALSLGLQHNVAAVLLRLLPVRVSAPPAAAQRVKMALVLACSTAVFNVARALDAEPLLGCVTMGMVVANRRPLEGSLGVVHAGGAGAGGGEGELHALVEAIMALTNVAFFGLAGASLKLSALAGSLWIALVVVLIRLASIMVGSEAGCRLGGARPEHRRLFWLSMVTQAGVALGLARIAGTHIPEWGPAFQTIMMAIIICNMLAGPPMFRAAIIAAGEAHALPGGGGGLLPTAKASASDGGAAAHGGGGGNGDGERERGSTLEAVVVKCDDAHPHPGVTSRGAASASPSVGGA